MIQKLERSIKPNLLLGDIVEISLMEGKFAYAQVGPSPLFIFFDGIYENRPSLDVILSREILFKLWVYSDALKGTRWKKVYSAELSSQNKNTPPMRKQDKVSGRLYIHHEDYRDTNYETPATLSEVRGMEVAAVWEMDHVESRIKDHYLGRPNKWIASMSIDFDKVPSDQLI